MHASPVTGRHIIERDPAVVVAERNGLSIGGERDGTNMHSPRDFAAQFTGLNVVDRSAIVLKPNGSEFCAANAEPSGEKHDDVILLPPGDSDRSSRRK